MRKFFLLMFIPLLLSADYIVTYKGDTVGEMKTIKTIFKGYLKGDLVFKARVATGLSSLVYYEPGHKPKVKNAKYMKDEAGLLAIGRMVASFKLRKPIVIDNEKQYISVKCNYKNDKTFLCKFSRQNKEDLMIYRGKILVINGKIEKICENRTQVCLLKKSE